MNTRLTVAGLVVVAGVMVGCRPSSTSVVPPAPAAPGGGIYRNVAESAGIRFNWGHASKAGLTILETLGHGAAWLDYDRDGKLDLLLVGRERPALFRNSGDGRFTDQTTAALPGLTDTPILHGAAAADYDQDGWTDLLLTGYGRRALYRNERGVFRNVTPASGLSARGPYDWSTSAAWADVDGDGDLDLYICRYLQFLPTSQQLCNYTDVNGQILQMTCNPHVYPAQKGSLYRNDGKGRFTEISGPAGVSDTQGKGLGVSFCDYNADGRPDFYVANDGQAGDLYMAAGPGRFLNVGVESGTAYGAEGSAQAGMGLDWGDCNGDARFDLVVATFEGEPKSLYLNRPGGVFEERSYASGLGAATIRLLAFGALFTDAGNRGILDLVFTNGHVFSEIEKVDPSTSYPQRLQYFRGRGDGRFQDAGTSAGSDFARPIVGRGIAAADYDEDGRMDLAVVDAEGSAILLRNEGKAGHWLELECRWRPGGPIAVGAVVTVTAGGKRRVGEVRAGGSYLSTNSPRLHFGLGESSAVEGLEIRWPGGRTTRLGPLAIDRLHELTPDAVGKLTTK